MNEAVYGLIGVGVGGGLTFLTTWFLHQQQIKEHQRISQEIKYDVHSRVFRRITYLIERYLAYTKVVNYNNLEEAFNVSQKTNDLIDTIENLDDSQLDGEGVMYYYTILETLNDISNKIVIYETRVDEQHGELIEIPHPNGHVTQNQIINLETLNNTIIAKHIQRYL